MHRFSFETIKVLITSYCNLSCKHCYQHFDKNKYRLSTETLCKIVDFSLENDTKTLDFGGGEFFTHPFAYELLDYCFSKGIHVNIATNATMLSIDYFKKLYNKDLLTIQISVDGLKESHDDRRGVGTFNKMLENAESLFKLGIPLTASMALDEKNYTDALDVLQMPYFSNVVFLPVALTGAAKNNVGNDLFDYEKTMCYIMEGTECGNGNFQNEIFPNVLAIKYDGKVYPAPVASDYGLMCIGNVNEQPIQQIVDNFFDSEAYRKLCSVNNMDISECNTCASSYKCNRGCRFRALKFYGDMLKPDPFYCRIFENTFDNIPLGELFWGENNKANKRNEIS